MNGYGRELLKYVAAAATGTMLLYGAVTAPVAIAQQKQTIKPTHVKFGWQRGIQMPYQMVRILDLGKHKNMSIDWTRFDSGPAMLPALQSGSIDMAQMGASPALVGITNGLDVSIIGIVQNIAGGEGLVARNGAGVNDVRDLRGKSVGVVLASSAHGGLIAALRKHSLKTSEISVVNIGPAQMLPAFQNANLDAVYIWDPYMTYAMNVGGKLILTTDQVGDLASFTASHGVWVVRNEFLRQNRDAVVRFILLAELGQRLYLEKGNESRFALSRLASELNLEPMVIQKMIDRVMFPTPAAQLDAGNNYAFAAASSSSPMRIVEGLAALAELQMQLGNLKKPLSVQAISKYVDASVLRTLRETPPLTIEGR